MGGSQVNRLLFVSYIWRRNQYRPAGTCILQVQKKWGGRIGDEPTIASATDDMLAIPHYGINYWSFIKGGRPMVYPVCKLIIDSIIL